MSEPAFHLVTRREFEAANPDVNYRRLGYKLHELATEHGPLEVLSRVWDASYNEPFEDYLSEAEEAYVTVGDDLVGRGFAFEAGSHLDLITIFRALDEDQDSYRYWNTPPRRQEFPYAADYEEQYGPDVEARLNELRDTYAATPGGAEALRYYRAHGWFEEHGIGDRG